MTTENKDLPALRAVSSAGRIHFGFQTYGWSELESTPLSYEATPERARSIAYGLLNAATAAESLARSFPNLAPRDDAKAIPASVRGTEDAETGDDGGIAEHGADL